MFDVFPRHKMGLVWKNGSMPKNLDAPLENVLVFSDACTLNHSQLLNTKTIFHIPGSN